MRKAKRKKLNEPSAPAPLPMVGMLPGSVASLIVGLTVSENGVFDQAKAGALRLSSKSLLEHVWYLHPAVVHLSSRSRMISVLLDRGQRSLRKLVLNVAPGQENPLEAFSGRSLPPLLELLSISGTDAECLTALERTKFSSFTLLQLCNTGMSKKLPQSVVQLHLSGATPAASLAPALARLKVSEIVIVHFSSSLNTVGFCRICGGCVCRTERVQGRKLRYGGLWLPRSNICRWRPLSRCPHLDHFPKALSSCIFLLSSLTPTLFSPSEISDLSSASISNSDPITPFPHSGESSLALKPFFLIASLSPLIACSLSARLDFLGASKSLRFQ